MKHVQTNSTALVDTETEQGMPETLYKTDVIKYIW